MRGDDELACETYVSEAARLHGLSIPEAHRPAVVANFRGLREVFRVLEGWRQAVGSDANDAPGDP